MITHRLTNFRRIIVAIIIFLVTYNLLINLAKVKTYEEVSAPILPTKSETNTVTKSTENTPANEQRRRNQQGINTQLIPDASLNKDEELKKNLTTADTVQRLRFEPLSIDEEEHTSIHTEEPTSIDTEEPTSIDTEEPTSIDTEEPIDAKEPASVDTEEQQQQDNDKITPEAPLHSNDVPKKSPLNIVLFYADDWTARTLGKINKNVKTPNIDAMANRGMMFTHNCVTTSICWMSRATLYTGLTYARHRMQKPSSETMFNQTTPWKKTLYPLLRQAGYHTGLVGKWHSPQPSEFMDYTFDWSKFYYGHHWEDRFVNGQHKKVHVTDCNEQDALHYLRNERPRNNDNGDKSGKPFALTVSFFATHSQDGQPFPDEYQPKNTSMGWYANESMPVPKTLTEKHWAEMPWFLHTPGDRNEARYRYKKRYSTPERFQVTMKNYYRMATEVDAAIGNIIQELKDQGVYNNTLLVFTTDNGMFHGEHQLAGKWYPHEESIRVPLIIEDPRMPASQRGRTNDDFTLNIDLAPTLLSAAGIDVPPHMQGRDISQLYLDATEKARRTWRKDFFYEWNMGEDNEVALNHNKDWWHIPAVFGLIRKDYKYFFWPNHKYGQLFHVSEDPFEEYDIFNATSNNNATILLEIKARYAYLKNRSQSGAPV